MYVVWNRIEKMLEFEQSVVIWKAPVTFSLSLLLFYNKQENPSEYMTHPNLTPFF